MDYLDFEIAIAATPTGGYTLTATCGEESATGDFTFALDDTLLENHLLKIQSAVLVRSAGVRLQLRDAERELQTFGITLFDALFTTPIRDLYRATRRRASTEGKRGVRLKLDIQEPRLAALPWEYLYHPGDQEFIGLSLHSPIIRTFPVATATPIILPRPLKILGMIANPYDQSQLDVQGENQRLEAALAPLGNQVQLEWVAKGTLAALQEALEDGEWHIFHYIGHGGFDRSRDEGFLALEDGDGKTKPAYATQLYRLFQRGQGLQLAVLNSCDSARHSRTDLISAPAIALVRRGLPAVLAMQFAIPDAVAKALTSHFYRALARGRAIEYALADARQSLTFDDVDALEWGVSVLYMRVVRRRIIPPSSPEVNESLWQELKDAESNKEWDTVIWIGELLLKRNHRADETCKKLVNAYTTRGRSEYSTNLYQECIGGFSRALQLEPNNSSHYRWRGVSYHVAALQNHPAGDFSKAIQDYTKAIQLDPNNAGFYFARGKSYHTATHRNHPIGHFTKAIQDYNKAIQLDPNKTAFYFARGKSYYSAANQNHPAGDFTKAIRDYSKAIQLDPNNAGFYFARGRSYHSAATQNHPSGDFTKAIQDYSKAIQLDPTNAAYYSERGNSYYSLNEDTKAVKDDTKAIELEPGNGKFYHNRALTYSALGKRAEAERDFAKAKELGYNPD